MTESQEIAVRKPAAIERPVTDPDARRQVVDELEAQVLLIREAMERTLVRDVHYGLIPGTQKPSLWQPGAEMLCQMFRFQTDMIRTGEHEDWDKGVFSYTYKCRLSSRNGDLITEREATCSSKEPNYANKNAFQIRETLMQMAQKRAYVSAVRGSAAASAIFSQDDDIVPSDGGPVDKGFGICEIHNVPYSLTEKQQAAGYRPSHKTDDGWCEKPVSKPAQPQQQPSAMSEARDALKQLVGEDRYKQADYIKSVLVGKVINHNDDITEADWIRVKESAISDLLDNEEYERQAALIDAEGG